jgi:hypothetical protein
MLSDIFSDPFMGLRFTAMVFKVGKLDLCELVGLMVCGTPLLVMCLWSQKMCQDVWFWTGLFGDDGLELVANIFNTTKV